MALVLHGCTCARLLADKGYNITLIDKNDYIGGICVDSLSDDKSCYIHQFGPHIFHTLNLTVWNFIKQFSEFNNYQHKYYAEYDNTKYVFPINLNTISELFNVQVYSKDDVSKLIHDVEIKNPKNFEEAAIASVGTKIYNAFIKNYTLKQWQTDPKELSVDIFKRINIKYDFNDNCFPNQYQGLPVNGYSNLFKNMINHKNIILELNQEFESYNTDKFDRIIYTGGFKDLPYRSTRFIHYQDNPTQYSVINLPSDPEYTRVTNFNILHKITEQNTLHNYCKELPVENNLENELLPVLTNTNINYFKIKQNELLIKYSNILFVGRLATYKYLDMDQAILEAINLVRGNF